MSETTKINAQQAKKALLMRLEKSARQYDDQCAKLADAIKIIKAEQVTALEEDCSDEFEAWDSAIIVQVALEGIAAGSLAISETDAQNVAAAELNTMMAAEVYLQCLNPPE